MKYELEVIRHTQFANYFLVVWDIIDFARRSQILYGVRGSAAASVALYCLGITDIDPLEYRLVFERFLHLERKEMPDIDMDFQDDRRDEVLHYVIERYGSDQVAQIISFGTLGAKAALRDVGRGMGMSYRDVDRIARMVPLKSRTIDEAIRANQDLRNAYQKEEQVRILVDNAQGLEGIVHHVSTHPAGVLIADEPLTDTVPLQRPPKGDENSPVMMSQYSMVPVAKLGLLKMDFLGLTALAILDHTVKLLRREPGHQDRHLKATPGRRENLRVALLRKDNGGLPVGERRDAEIHQGTPAIHPGRHCRDDRSLPARADGAHRHIHPGQARPDPNHQPPREPEGVAR